MVVVAFLMVVVGRPPLTFVRRTIGWLASLRPSPTSWTSFWQRRRAFRSRYYSLVHPFEQIFEVVEPALPEAGHLACPVDQRCQGPELSAIVRPATFVAVAHQPGLLQDPEMLRDGRLRDPGLSRQGPDRLVSVATQPLEDGPSRRIGERSEKDIVGLWHRN